MSLFISVFFGFCAGGVFEVFLRLRRGKVNQGPGLRRLSPLLPENPGLIGWGTLGILGGVVFGGLGKALGDLPLDSWRGMLVSFGGALLLLVSSFAICSLRFFALRETKERVENSSSSI